MKKIILLLFIAASHLLFSRDNDFRIVGYLPQYRMDSVDISISQYLDDLIYFNLRVDSTGGLDWSVISEEGIRKMKQIKSRYGVRTQICIAGWWTTTGKYFAPVVTNDSLRSRLVHNLLDFCLQYGFDGVDYDWEHPQSREEIEAYADLFEETKAAFAPYGLIISAAVSGHTLFPSRAYEALDKIHIMSYGGRHITYNAGVSEVSVFLSQEDIPSEKLYFGTPFYGYADDRPYYTYNSIVRLYDPGPEFNIVDGIMYQGIYAQERRTLFAHAHNMGGIMIWEVGQDSPGEKSLLKAIRTTVNELRKLPAPEFIYMAPVARQDGQVLLQFSAIPGAIRYHILLSDKSGLIIDSLDTDSTIHVFKGLTPGCLYYTQVIGVSGDGAPGQASKMMAAVPGPRFKQVVIINEYDPWHKPRNLIKRHTSLFHQRGYGISSIYGSDIGESGAFSGEPVIDWLVGDKGHYAPAINGAHKELLARILENGGKLFISGANIGYDLYLKGSTSDKIFHLSYLKSLCRDDAPKKLVSKFYTLEAGPGSIFEGIDSITFDDGRAGGYNVFSPDVLDPKIYSNAGLLFSGMGQKPDEACVYFSGAFGNGLHNGALVYLSVPFECIYPQKSRKDVLCRILDYFEQPTHVAEKHRTTRQQRVCSYPNPFNPSTIIEYKTVEPAIVSIRICNVLGETVVWHREKNIMPGVHRFMWNAENLPAGNYFYDVMLGSEKYSGKMLYLK